MKKVFCILTSFVIFSGAAMADPDGIKDCLEEIESNNLTLKALQASLRAQEMENSLSATLEDPQVEYNYLWGNPSLIGPRQDFSVSQSFDFATITGARRKASRSRNELARSEYLASRQALLMHAQDLLLDVIYYNALISYMEKRVEVADEMTALYEKRFSGGQVNQLEYNDVLLKSSSLSLKMKRLMVEREALLTELRSLNGGQDIGSDLGGEYDCILLPDSFEEWAQEASLKSPALSYVRAQVRLSEQELALKKSETAPTVSLGYMGEFTPDEKFQGISLGVSVPLWSARRSVQQAKASLNAAQCREREAQLTFYHSLEVQYQNTVGLEKVATAYMMSIYKVSENVSLLQRAVDRGAISVLDYMQQMELFYDSLEESLDAQRAFQKSFAQLTAFEL